MASLQDAIDYVLACRGAPYTWWYSGELTEGAPAWSENAPPPDPSVIRAQGGFCAAVPNLMLRVRGITIPYRPGLVEPYRSWWDGGTLAYGEYLWGASEWFSSGKNYPDGTLLLKRYVEGVTQGHVAVVYRGYVIESIDATGDGRPGFSWERSVQDSHSWIGYELAVTPEKWIGVDRPVAKPDPDPPTTEPEKPSAVPFTADLFQRAMPGLSDADAKRYFPHLLEALNRFEINTHARISAFIGQCAHESGDLVYWEEIDGEYKNYAPWYGRGPIQLTWEANYEKAGNYLGLDLTSEAGRESVATPEVGFLTSCWFWRFGNGDLNPLADEATWDSYLEITHRVNGAETGKDDRDRRYLWAWNNLPFGLTLDAPQKPEDGPQEPPRPPPKESPIKRLAKLKKRLDAFLSNLDVEELEKVVDELEKDFEEIKELLK